MGGERSLTAEPGEAEVRIELTAAEVRQVWALYSRPAQALRSRAARIRDANAAPLSDLLRVAWKGRRTLATSCAVALALGVAFLLLATPTLRVTAQVVVESRGASLGAEDERSGPSAFLAGQAEILGSAAIVRDAWFESEPATPAKGLVATLREQLPLPARSPEEIEREALAEALAAFSVTPVFGTNVLALEYRTQDPASGVRLVQAAIDRYAELARTLGSGEAGFAVRTIAPPTRQGSAVWPRPAPVLFACLVLGVVVGFARTALLDRARCPGAGWGEIGEVAWAG